MVIVKLMGGLGNQMFQYAAAKRLAHVSNVPLKLDLSWFDTAAGATTPREYALHPFSLAQDFASPSETARVATPFRNLASLASRFSGFGSAYLREQHYHFDPSLLVPRKRAYLDGYWQSERYFQDIAEMIAGAFSIKTAPEGLNRSLAQQICGDQITAVSLHVRRGDYVDNPAVTHFHGNCSPQYYAAAVSRIACAVPNPHFFIFSDDPVWVADRFAIDQPFTVVGHNGAAAAHEDLRLMSLCKHHIIANSTFSWWGGWLSGNRAKMVIAPQKWFGSATMNPKDVIPESWIKI